MNAYELKQILNDTPDDWTVVVEQPKGDRYHADGARRDPQKDELVIGL